MVLPWKSVLLLHVIAWQHWQHLLVVLHWLPHICVWCRLEVAVSTHITQRWSGVVTIKKPTMLPLLEYMHIVRRSAPRGAKKRWKTGKNNILFKIICQMTRWLATIIIRHDDLGYSICHWMTEAWGGITQIALDLYSPLCPLFCSTVPIVLTRFWS